MSGPELFVITEFDRIFVQPMLLLRILKLSFNNQGKNALQFLAFSWEILLFKIEIARDKK
jgi:hypothetical protein